MGIFNSSCPVPAGSEDYDVRGSSWKPMVWSAAACTIATLAISLALIVLHLRRYRSPKEQRQIIRIIFIVDIYAIVAFFEIWSYEAAQYIDPIGDLYEAFGLCALYLLLVQYAAPSGTFNQDLFDTVKAAEESSSTFDWPRIGWIFVFQYPIIEILCVAIIEATEATGRYCVNSLEPQFAHLWVEILQSISIGACVLAIIAFRNRMKGLMKCRRGLAKILCFKVIVFIRFTQAWVFSLLLQYKVVKTSASFSYNDILWGIPGLATCAEMVIFAGGFWYAFSSTEYGSSAKPLERPLPLWRAVLDALNPADLILGIWRIFPLWTEVHRTDGWKDWRAARKEAGIQGAVRKGVRKYKNRKGEKAGRYQELNESMEQLKQPTESHHGRTLSDVSRPESYPMASMGEQELYHPPAGSPPDDAGTHLMAEPYQGRPRSASQGRWNGQSYDRSPSPSPGVDLGAATRYERDMI